MEKICSVCAKTTDSETAAILAIGGYGNAKYLCTDCEEDLELVTKGKDTALISEAMDRITERLNSANVDDRVVVSTLCEMFDSAKERAEKIDNGSYDFSLDEVEGESFEITDEYKETEEDKALDREELEAKEKEDKITGWFMLGIVVCVVGLLIYKLVDSLI